MSKDLEHYKRFPIQLSEDTFLLLHIFNRDLNHSFESAWLSDNDAYFGTEMEVYKRAADQFISQLEGEECELFIIALKNRCEEYINKCNERRRKLDYEKAK